MAGRVRGRVFGAEEAGGGACVQSCCEADGSRFVRRPIPWPVPASCCLRTLSTAICASDVHYMDSPELVTSGGSDMFVYDEDRDVVMGHEFVGEVVAHGPGCSDQFPVGTRVTSMPVRLVDGGAGGHRVIGQHPEAQGSFGELLVVSEVMTRVAPGPVSSDAVALVDAFAVGESYVNSSHITPGEIPIVVGAGAIGLSAVAALSARGIDPVIASDYKPERLDLAQTFGAHVLVNPADRSPFEVWRELAAAAVSPRRRWSSSASAPPDCSRTSSSRATWARASSPRVAGTPATPSTAPRRPTRA